MQRSVLEPVRVRPIAKIKWLNSKKSAILLRIKKLSKINLLILSKHDICHDQADFGRFTKVVTTQVLVLDNGRLS